MNNVTSATRWENAELDAETAAVQHSLTARRHPAAAELLERHAASFAGDAGLFGSKADRYGRRAA